MSKMRFALAALLLGAAVAIAAGPPPAKPAPKPDPASLDDRLDYLFLASDRPVTIRIHLRLGDKPYAQEWSLWMDKLFEWFDKNNDGHLDLKEVTRLPQPQTLVYHLQGSIGGFFPGTVVFNTLDTNKDGKVSRDEFRAYYRKNQLAALRLSQSNYQANEADKINKAIYARVNQKKDGKLTQADASRLPELISKLDENEDELIAVSEINTRADGGYGTFAVPVTYDAPTRRGPGNDWGLIDVKEAPSADLVKKLLTAYDRNKDGKLTATEIGLDKTEFAALDGNKDGQLDATELAVYLRREPDLVLRARVGAIGASNTVLSGISKLLGNKQTPADRAELLKSLNRPMPLARNVKKLNGDSLQLSLGDAGISFTASQGSGAQGGAKSFYLRQFDNIANKMESITRKQVMGDYYLNQMFSQADKNGDDKLTRKELSDWLDLLGKGGGAFVSMSVNDLGRSLFQVVDANRDNQLSIRELRSAWDRIKPLCKDGKSLQVKDMPRSLTITLNQGMYNYGGGGIVPPSIAGGMGFPVSARGGQAPLWFRKTDRNNDGDLSPKEWLGTDEEFTEIDADGDGLISADEAARFDAKMKKQEKEKDATKKGGKAEQQGPPVKKQP